MCTPRLSHTFACSSLYTCESRREAQRRSSGICFRVTRRTAEFSVNGKPPPHPKTPEFCAQRVVVVIRSAPFVCAPQQSLFGDDNRVPVERRKPVGEARADDDVRVNPHDFVGPFANQFKQGLRLYIPRVSAGRRNGANIDRDFRKLRGEADEILIRKRAEQNDRTTGLGASEAQEQQAQSGFARGPVFSYADRGRPLGGTGRFSPCSSSLWLAILTPRFATHRTPGPAQRAPRL